MTTLDESVSVAYRSSSVAYAAARTKHAIAVQKLKEFRNEKQQILNNEGRESPEFKVNELRKAIWNNYATANRYAMRFFERDSTVVKGIKPRLEDLWVQMGNNLADLPDWDQRASLDLKTVISFSNFNGPVNVQTVLDTEALFTGNSDEIPTTDFLTQFEEMFDLFINDIWASEGMREWTRDELNRGPESQADLDVWDSINGDAGVFFDNARGCAIRIATQLSQSELGGSQYANYLNKYVKRQNNKYNAVEGLFAIDPSDLPNNQYRNRVEGKKITVR